MRRTATVAHSRDGFTLHVTDTPWWAATVRATAEEALEVLGHPCCGRGLGRSDPVRDVAFTFMQVVDRFEADRQRIVLDIEVTADQAHQLAPEFVDAWEGDVGCED